MDLLFIINKENYLYAHEKDKTTRNTVSMENASKYSL